MRTFLVFFIVVVLTFFTSPLTIWIVRGFVIAAGQMVIVHNESVQLKPSRSRGRGGGRLNKTNINRGYGVSNEVGCERVSANCID